MDTRFDGRRSSVPAVIGAALAGAMLMAAPAAAQPHDDGLREDSLGVAGDARPLRLERAEAMECAPLGLRVVRDTADLRAIERFRGCGPSAFPALGRDLYVHVSMMGDCHARLWAEAFRSESRREYRIVMMNRYGGCRAGRFESYWLRLPPLPDGWTVAFSSRRFDRDEDVPSSAPPPTP